MNARDKLYTLCKASNVSKGAINSLINYYVKYNGWSEKQAIDYAIQLFLNGTIGKIKNL